MSRSLVMSGTARLTVGALRSFSNVGRQSSVLAMNSATARAQ
ncbi:MAG TPA: hypothetical protein PLJ27_09705 [Polyangiaceae bacterium]|nr:hypothetical protein [Polyangiaceae bacterium]HQK17720.1 hypothetical protein [Polyangiaceae bacterium]HQM11034.1 hypothetical protein [Polyangiaceae bacterium]